MLLFSRSAGQSEYFSVERTTRGGCSALKVLLSFCLVLTALLCVGGGRSTAYADDAVAYDRIYYFNMDSKGTQGNMMLVQTTDANGVPHWGLLDAGHRYAKTIQDENGRSYSTTVHGLSSQINCHNGKDVAQYMINYLGVKHLDFIIGTHAHSDHVGGIPELVATTFVDSQGVTRSLVDSNTTYYYKEYQHISNLEDDLVKYTSSSWHNQAFAYQAAYAMQEAGATLVDLSKLDAFSDLPEGLRFVTRGELGDEYGDSVEFTVGGITFRLYNLYEHTDTGNENVNSIVAVMSNGQYTVVNLADINTNHGAIDKVSAAIAEAYGTVDIVVAGHHGATGSNTKEMFDQLQPDFVVVSNGSSETSWFYTTGDLAAAIPYANARYGTDFYGTGISYYATVTDLSGNAVHIYSVDNAGALEDAMSRILTANKKKTGWVSWAQTDGTLWTYLEKGDSVKDAWRQVSGKWYHFDEYGIMQTGWIEADGTVYYLDPGSGAAKSGWMQRDSDWYYLNPNARGFGKPVTGWQTISNKRYYFNESGVMLSETWVDGYYLSSSGAMATGWIQEANGDWYYLNPNTKARTYGKILVGWQTIGGKKYFFEENGVMKHDTWQDTYYLTHDGWVATGFQTIDGETYYFDPNTKAKTYGRILTGWRNIGKYRYFFDDEGRMQKGWLDDTFYLREDGTIQTGLGSMATGWLNLGTEESPVWYYMDANAKARSYGRRLTGWQTIGGKKYFFEDNGVMAHDTWVDSFYMTHGGPVATGLQVIDGETYYFDPNTKSRSFGRILTGWRNINNKRYYFDDEGRMQRGWLDDTFYLKEDGSMATGWLNLGTEVSPVWYYMDPNAKARSYGRRLTGWQTIGGKKYYFDDYGVMAHDTWVDSFFLTHDGPVATGLQVINGETYYFDPNTKNKSFGRALTGWRTINNKRYFFDDEGRMQKGWYDDTFYLNDDGSMATGWKEINGTWYYLDPNAKAKTYGRKLLGWQTIGGKKYYFDDNGAMAHDTWVDSFYLTHDGPVATGFQILDGETYYFDPNTKNKTFGRALTGWRTISGKYYYFDDEGRIQRGWLDDTYFLNADGVMATGWKEDGGYWYYLDPNAKAKTYGRKLLGWQTIGGKRYYLDDNGRMVKDSWSDGRYLDGDGVMAAGWKEIPSGSGSWYYLNPNAKDRNYGRALTGWQTISGKRYCFDDNGLMLRNTWQDDYYLDDSGVLATGLVYTSTGTYYLNPNAKAKNYGRALTGWQQIGGKWYYFDDSGKMLSGTWTEDGFYLTAEGPMAASCWQTLNGKHYYFDAKGNKLTGWQTVNGKKYFFNEDGSAAVNTWTEAGWLDENGVVTTGLVTDAEGRTYYVDAKGNKLTGWQNVNGAEHYFGTDGVLAANDWATDGRYVSGDGTPASGMMNVEGGTYFFSNGTKLTGWQSANGTEYYFGEDGALAADTWAADGRYVSGDGSLQTGWKSIGGAWYYFEADGRKHTGWLEDNGATYYFNAEGVMVTGEQTIDGESYYFNEDGSLYVAPVVENTVIDENGDGGDDGAGNGKGGSGETPVTNPEVG